MDYSVFDDSLLDLICDLAEDNDNEPFNIANDDDEFISHETVNYENNNDSNGRQGDMNMHGDATSHFRQSCHGREEMNVTKDDILLPNREFYHRRETSLPTCSTESFKSQDTLQREANQSQDEKERIHTYHNHYYIDGSKSSKTIVSTRLIDQFCINEKKAEMYKAMERSDKLEEDNNVEKENGSKLGANKVYAQILKDNQTVLLGFQRHIETKSETKPLPRDVLRYFIEKGRDVDEWGLNPIHRACIDYSYNSKLIAMMLRALPQSIEFQVKPRPVDGLKNDMIVSGMFPIHVAIMNHASIDVIKLLVRAGPHILSKQDENGMVPISLALQLRDESKDVEQYNNMLIFLLKANPLAAAVADKRSNTPLHYACMMSRHPGGLIRQKNVIHADHKISSTALVTESCIEGEIINQPTPSSTQPSRSSEASMSKTTIFEVIYNLIEANSDAVVQQNFNGDTPLDLAQNNDKFDESSIALLQSMVCKDEQFEDAPLDI